MKLGELLEQVSIKLAGIGLAVGEAELAINAAVVIAGLADRYGIDAPVEDRIESDPEFLPSEMPNTALIRHMLTLPMQYRMRPGDVVTVVKMVGLISEIQAFLDRYDLVSTARGPIPKGRAL